MIENLNRNKALWCITSILSLIVSITGIFNQGIYSRVVTAQWLPGTISQDVITVLSSLILLVLTLSIRKRHTKLQIVILSSLLYLFYGYGIYTIEQLYNSFYLLYVSIFALSFWSVVYSMICLRRDFIDKVRITNTIRYISIGTSFLISVLFYILWISQLLPLMQTGEKIDFTFSIYILDMSFILPALIISAVLVLKRIGLGLVLLPVLFIKAFTLLFSVGLGGLLKPFYSQSTNSAETVFYISLSILFLILAILSLIRLEVPERQT